MRFSDQGTEQKEVPGELRSAHHPWFSRSVISTIFWTLITAGAAWSLMALWNTLHLVGMQFSGGIQQVVLVVIATTGIPASSTSTLAVTLTLPGFC